MGTYYGVNIRLKLKKDAPTAVQQFMDKALIEAELEQALTELAFQPVDETHAVKIANLRQHDELGNLCSMICQRSTHFSTWCWNVKEDRGDHWLYETRGGCSSRRIDKVLLMMLVAVLAPYLDTGDDDILARILGEEDVEEDVLVIDPTGREANWFDGYRYETLSGDLHDSDHPAQSYYSGVLSDADDTQPHTRLIAEDAEFTPPWNYKALEELNQTNKAKWDEENAANWWQSLN